MPGAYINTFSHMRSFQKRIVIEAYRIAVSEARRSGGIMSFKIFMLFMILGITSLVTSQVTSKY